MDRRSVLSAGGAAALSLAVMGAPKGAPGADAAPIVDSHIHLFDPNRPQGTPAVIPGSSTTRTGSFPAAYRQWAEPLGVVGAVHIEASNWVEDNLWALEVANANDIMVGVIGNLDPRRTEFDEFLDRFHRDPLFRGIRYGNIWGYDIVEGSTDAGVIARLKRLSEYGLVMDTATPRIDLLEAVVRVNDAIPQLRIVIDHLPGFDPERGAVANYERVLRELSTRPTVHAKLSQVIHRRENGVSTRLADYRESLDRIVGGFGDDRVLFGSDYPNSDMVTTPQEVFRVARDYVATRSGQFQHKVLYRNTWRVYACRARTALQRQLHLA